MWAEAGNLRAEAGKARCYIRFTKGACKMVFKRRYKMGIYHDGRAGIWDTCI